MAKKLTGKNQSAENVLHILELMANNDEEMRLQDIAASTGIPASTTLRLLNTLMSNDYVKQNPDTLRYALSTKISYLGDMVSSRINLRHLARPYMDELSKIVGLSVCLVVVSDMKAMYIEVINSPSSFLQVNTSIGRRLALHATASGKALLMGFTENELDEYADSVDFVRYTENTITDKARLLAEIKRSAARGYTMDKEEMQLGARCLAAPIYDHHGRVVAAINTTGTIYEVTDSRIGGIANALLDTVRRISAELGNTPA